MFIRPLPKKWLIHEITYEGFTGEKDDWGNEAYEQPLTIKNVRFDDSTVFSRDKTQTKVVANAVIFIDATNSSPLPSEFKEQSKVKFKGKEYIVQKVVPCYYPNKDEVRHWELEVI